MFVSYKKSRIKKKKKRFKYNLLIPKLKIFLGVSMDYEKLISMTIEEIARTFNVRSLYLQENRNSLVRHHLYPDLSSLVKQSLKERLGYTPKTFSLFQYNSSVLKGDTLLVRVSKGQIKP